MKKEPGMAYNTKTLNKVFVVLSILFLFAMVWMVIDDYLRPWKIVQMQGLDIEREELEKKIAEADEGIDKEKLSEVENQIKSEEAKITKSQVELQGLNDKLSELEKEIYAQNLYNGVAGSASAAKQFKYEHALMEKHLIEAKEYKKELDKLQADFAKGKDDLKKLQAKEKVLKDQLKEIENGLANAEREKKKLTEKRDLLLISYAQTKKDPIFFLRNLPFIDYLDPTIKVRQVVLDNITDDRYFQHVPKVDRCTTCHVFIDKPGFEKKDNPYKTHPRLDSLAVGRNSKHPIKQFGCTSCHGGEGHRVNDFNAAVHMPQNLAQQKEWEKKYHWHEPHKIPQPMLPLQYTEASCVKCHQGVERIGMAENLNHGRKLIEQYGCYGCHKIEGWQHLKKPGPSLAKVASKTNKEFIKNWIWSPHAFNPKSKMPAFFNQVNNSKPEFMKRNIVEVNAMSEYIWKKSKAYKPFAKYAGGNAETGKALIQKVGCMACHGVEGVDEPFNKVKSRKGPYLTGTGSKVDPDWLVSWLIKPSHYQADTIMPSFRLSPKEANDISAYLLTLKNKKFERLKFDGLDKGIRDELLVGYFSQFDSIDSAKAKIAKLSDEEKTLELGHRSIGKYGCYSCHNIDGFADDRPPIGPELTKVGSKPIEQFGYGQQKHIPHTRHAWVWHHLEQPARWDIGVPKPFKDLNRMPNFYLSKGEIDKMVTAILGQVSDYIPLAGRKTLSAHEKLAEDGKKIVNKYNCKGCHVIDGDGGNLRVVYDEDDPNYGPPWLMAQGHRVHTDWFYKFLNNVWTIRPYVEIRMPQFEFSNDEVNKIVNYFRAEADQPTFDPAPAKVVWKPGERQAAAKMWDELACTSCHALGFTNDEALAPNLKHAKKRLRASWIKKWLTDPTAILEYTSMPNFWEGGTTSAVDGVLGDDPKKQIEAMVKWVLEMGNDKLPTPLKQYGPDTTKGTTLSEPKTAGSGSSEKKPKQNKKKVESKQSFSKPDQNKKTETGKQKKVTLL